MIKPPQPSRTLPLKIKPLAAAEARGNFFYFDGCLMAKV